MAFMMEKILTDARKLANRLKEHDGSTDNLVTQMTTLNKKIDSMKTFQENLPDLNELVLRKPRSTVKLGLSQENSQIRELEQENKELKQSLEEHELALELIMSRYRQQVAKLLVSNKVDESMMYKETVQSQEVQDKAEHIHEMGSVMWKAISDDDRSMYDTQQLLAQLRIENEGMRELLHICSSSGNPLRISDRQTQTDGLSLFSSTIHNESSAVSPPAASGACRGGKAPCTPTTTAVTGATMKVLTALKSLKLGEKDSLRDGSAAGGSKAGQERDEQASVVGSLETASAFVLPSDAFASSSQSTSSAAQESNSPEKMMTSSNSPEKMTSSNSPEKMTSSNSPEKMITSSNSPEKMMTSSNSPEKMTTSSNSPEKMSSSEPCSSQGLTTTAGNEDQQQIPLGKGSVEVSLVSSSSSIVVTDESNEVEEQQPTILRAPETAEDTSSSSQETLSEPTTTTPRLPELVLENHADENHIPNDEVVETLATDDDGQSRPSVVESVVAVGATQELDNSPRAPSSSPLSNTTTASSTTSSSTTTESTPSSSQSRHLASSSTVKNQTNSPKSAALSSGKHAVSSSSGGTPRNPSSGHVTPQKTAATPSSGSSTSRLKHGATTTPSGVPSKTPTRSPAARDSAPGSSSGAATAVKLTGSPSVHSAKTSAAAHSPRATPIRIKAARQPSPVVASVASPATNSSPSTTTTTSCVPLDSNGNSHTTTTSPTTVLNEISNINNMPKDATVDGQ